MEIATSVYFAIDGDILYLVSSVVSIIAGICTILTYQKSKQKSNLRFIKVVVTSFVIN